VKDCRRWLLHQLKHFPTMSRLHDLGTLLGIHGGRAIDYVSRWFCRKTGIRSVLLLVLWNTDQQRFGRATKMFSMFGLILTAYFSHARGDPWPAHNIINVRITTPKSAQNMFQKSFVMRSRICVELSIQPVRQIGQINPSNNEAEWNTDSSSVWILIIFCSSECRLLHVQRLQVKGIRTPIWLINIRSSGVEKRDGDSRKAFDDEVSVAGTPQRLLSFSSSLPAILIGMTSDKKNSL